MIERPLTAVSCSGCGDPEPTIRVETRFGPSLRCDNCQASIEEEGSSWHDVSSQWKPLSEQFRCSAKDLQAAVQHGLRESSEMVGIVEAFLDTMRRQPGRRPQTIELDDATKKQIWELHKQGFSLAKIAARVTPGGLTAMQIQTVIRRIESDNYFSKARRLRADLESINQTNEG